MTDSSPKRPIFYFTFRLSLEKGAYIELSTSGATAEEALARELACWEGGEKNLSLGDQPATLFLPSGFFGRHFSLECLVRRVTAAGEEERATPDSPWWKVTVGSAVSSAERICTWQDGPERLLLEEIPEAGWRLTLGDRIIGELRENALSSVPIAWADAQFAGFRIEGKGFDAVAVWADGTRRPLV